MKGMTRKIETLLIDLDDTLYRYASRILVVPSRNSNPEDGCLLSKVLTFETSYVFHGKNFFKLEVVGHVKHSQSN